MSVPKIEGTDPSVPFPSITIRDFLVGMLAMVILNWAVLIFFVSAIPLLALLGLGFLHNSVFKIHPLFVLTLIIAISLGANIVQIARWCIRNIFSSVLYRIFALAILATWLIITMRWSTVDYLGLVLAASVFLFSIWDAISDWLRIN
jgi:hypothetical protein